MIPDRVAVILRSAVTWLTLAAFVVQTVADEIVAVLPSDTAEAVALIAVRILAWLAAAVAIIRRVSPVPTEERGLLPRESDGV